MRILVVGAAGFIGSTLTHQLLVEGHEVIGVDCFLHQSYSAAIKQRNIQDFLAQPNFTFVRSDASQPLPEDAWGGVSAVVNLAAMPGLPLSWEDFDLYQTCNFTLVSQLLKEATKRDVSHFIQISTSSIYGAIALGDESEPPKPVSPYGVTKLAGENLVAAYGASMRLPYTTLRLYSVYGPRQRPDMAYHIFCESILDGREITIFGDGRQTRTNTYVDDAVRAISLTLSHGPTNDSFDVAGSEPISLLEALALVEKALDRPAKVAFAEQRPGDQKQTAGATGRTRLRLGFSPETGIVEGIQRQATWHLASRD